MGTDPKVVMIGAGPTGLATGLLAKALGAHLVIGTDPVLVRWGLHPMAP